MKRETKITADGSYTILIPEMNVTYHSHYGALQESQHVFIKEGLLHFVNNAPKADWINIFEMGFGTGLNAWLSLEQSIQLSLKINYEAVELHPLTEEEIALLPDPEMPGVSGVSLKEIQYAKWNECIEFTPAFHLTKWHTSLQHFNVKNRFNIIYYDAFAPAAQPELWEPSIFKKLHDMLDDNGMLVTYCSKGIVRRSLQQVGFTVEKPTGPAGKREMIRAKKINSFKEPIVAG